MVESQFWDELPYARRALVRAAVSGTAPPRQAVAALDAWIDELGAVPEGAVSAGHMATMWGNALVLLVDAGPESAEGLRTGGDTGPAWQRVRRAAEQLLLALGSRAEWASLQSDLRDEVLPWLADAVTRPREGRVLRCREATHRLRQLAHRTGGQPHAWRIRRVAEMGYPLVTPGGWVGRMGDDFTWPRAEAVVHALLDLLEARHLAGLPLVVGFDSRIHADLLAELVSELATQAGFPVHLCSRATPTPALISYAVDTLGVEGNAGILVCTASRLPVKDPASGRYLGNSYQGLRYYTPYGAVLPQAQTQHLARHIAEALLDPPEPTVAETPGAVTMLNLQGEYVQELVAELGFPITTAEGNEVLARDAVREFWGRPRALVLLDAMHGAAQGYLSAVCAKLNVACTALHETPDPLFGTLPAANPAPPALGDLQAQVKISGEEHMPIIGLAFDVEADRLGVVDETGALLPENALPAIIADYLLNDAFSGEPGRLIRDHAATRMLDRLASSYAAAGRMQAPTNHGALPAYQRESGYQQLTGDPHLLAGAGVTVVRAAACGLLGPVTAEVERALTRRRAGGAPAGNAQEILQESLDGIFLAGDGEGGIITHAHGPAQDALWAALMLLQACAVQRVPPGALWRRLESRMGTLVYQRQALEAPLAARLMLINRYMERYTRVSEHQLTTSEYRLADCFVSYAGGRRDQFIEWALIDPDGQPAFLLVRNREVLPQVEIIAESANAALTQRLVTAITRQVDTHLREVLQRAASPWRMVDVLAECQLPSAPATNPPGMLNCRLAQAAYTRLQELAHPGRDAPSLLRFLIDRLSERSPEKGRLLAACRLVEERPAKPAPPTPKVTWEEEERGAEGGGGGGGETRREEDP